MGAFSLRRFTRPETLRGISREKLLELLAPHRDYFVSRGVAMPMPGTHEPFDVETLIPVFLTPDRAMPMDLVESLYLINELATPKGMDAILRETRSLGIRLPLPWQPTALDVAVCAFLFMSLTQHYVDPVGAEGLQRHGCVYVSMDEAVRCGENGELELVQELREIVSLRLPSGSGAQNPKNAENVFRKQGDTWMLSYEGQTIYLQDSKGVACIACLLRSPDVELHVAQVLADVAGRAETPVLGSAGEVLTPDAIMKYKEAILDLRARIRNAEQNNDLGTKATCEEELDALTRQLAGAFGLGNRARQASDDADRIRKTIRGNIKRCLDKIKETHPPLWHHLSQSLKTGYFLAYKPFPSIHWSLQTSSSSARFNRVGPVFFPGFQPAIVITHRQHAIERYINARTAMTHTLKTLLTAIAAPILGEQWKLWKELRYWRARKAAEGVLTNGHYKFFFTTLFGLDDAFYEGKRVLDIGCGPRGSLEWANMTGRRVGLDPLANEYLKLGACMHRMEYFAAPSEAIPFEDSYFDVVSAFNSLDHVNDVAATVREMKRVLRPGGLILILVEVNHPPTPTEPHRLTPRIVEQFAPECRCLTGDVYAPSSSGAYQSARNGEKLPEGLGATACGWLSAKLVKTNP